MAPKDHSKSGNGAGALPPGPKQEPIQGPLRPGQYTLRRDTADDDTGTQPFPWGMNVPSRHSRSIGKRSGHSAPPPPRPVTPGLVQGQVPRVPGFKAPPPSLTEPPPVAKTLKVSPEAQRVLDRVVQVLPAQDRADLM